MEFNEEKVSKIKSEILNSLSMLEDLKSLPLKDFSRDKHKISSAKYNFIVAIEGMIDLCNHVISRNNFSTPADYSDGFKILSAKGAFDGELLANLIMAVRFRNRLVHIYWEVDVNELYNILNSGPDDIRKFLTGFTGFITGNCDPS